MRVIYLALLLSLITTVSFAQKKKNSKNIPTPPAIEWEKLVEMGNEFECKTEEERTQLIEKFLQHTEYKYNFRRKYRSTPYEVFEYLEDNQEKETLNLLIFKFREVVTGDNPALEIEGDKFYSLDEIRGRYLDLFPIWKVYVDNDADLEKTSLEKRIEIEEVKDKRYINFEFIPQQNNKKYWVLSYSNGTRSIL